MIGDAKEENENKRLCFGEPEKSLGAFLITKRPLHEVLANATDIWQSSNTLYRNSRFSKKKILCSYFCQLLQILTAKNEVRVILGRNDRK